MVFNSLEFILFFIVVYFLYRLLGHRSQNRMLLVASYIFYGFWDWRFLGLIFLSTVVDYLCGLKIDGETNAGRRKVYLLLSVITNLSILGFFKYFNFFAGSFSALFSNFGLEIDYVTLNIVLPLGISFYTFQTMSYTIDIYRGEMKSTRNFFDFALYVAFFPQLVAGPIERAARLLPQITGPRKITKTQVNEGAWLILWGFFKKIFIADNLALLVNSVFSETGELTGNEVLVASYAFAFQIYGDFSGYSDIARGISKLLGIDIMVNFRFPYFVTNPRDFWRNWHISLSTWLRDYLYIPLGGSKCANTLLYRNIMITMLLGGLWHGANWTFILWGFYHGILLCVYRVISPYLKRINISSVVAPFWFALRLIFMFHLTIFGWLIFRVDSFEQLIGMLHSLVYNYRLVDNTSSYYFMQVLFYASILILIQLFKSYKDDMYAILKLPVILRWSIYSVIFYLILLFGEFGVQEFIYFQF